MPDLDGFEVLETIREVTNVPVIMLTAKGEEDDRVRGLELERTITSQAVQPARTREPRQSRAAPHGRRHRFHARTHRSGQPTED